MRLEWLLAAAVVVAVVVALVASTLGSGGAGGGGTAPSARPAATAFARAYLAFLDGHLTASALPAATPQARAQAGTQLPADERFGRLALGRLVLRTVFGAPAATGLFAGRDDRGHRLDVQIALAFRDRRWQVIRIVAPDLTTAFKPRRAAHAAAPQAARRAAAAFARAYLDWVERVSPRRPSGGPAVARQLRAGTDPLSSLHATHRRARVLALQLGPPSGGSVGVIVRFSVAGVAPQTFAFVLGRAGARWRVSELIPGSLGVRS
jgi:hypothetical protein